MTVADYHAAEQAEPPMPNDPGAPPRGATRPLEALNFLMADMQAGIGPFLGVFLQSAFATVSLALWIGFGAMLRPACDGTAGGAPATA